MSTKRLFGTLIGWYLAGPAGGILGAFLGEWIPDNAIPDVSDVIQEMLGGLAADKVKDFSGISQFLPRPVPEGYRNRIQEACQIAFKEAVAEIGSNSCKKLPRKNPPANVAYHVSGLAYKRHDRLVQQVCDLFEELYNSSEKWFPPSTATEVVPLPESFDRVQDISQQWIEVQLDKHLVSYDSLIQELASLGDVYNLKAHLLKYLPARILAQFSNQLTINPELWRVYSSVYQQNLMAVLKNQTAIIESHFQEIIPNIYETMTLLRTFSEQFAERDSASESLLTELVTEYRQNQTGLAELQKQIGEQFEQLRLDLSKITDKELNVEWISDEKMTPIEPLDKKLILGQTITTRQIRENRFMGRPELLHSLVDALDEVGLASEKSRKSGYPRLHVLWIKGRSGSGKSVLLLQLMQRLVQERRAPILWLQDSTEALPEVIKRWTNYDIPVDKPTYIFLDDFYSAQSRGVHLKAIAQVLNRSDADQYNWPILVTCSPPENVIQFNEDLHEGFVINEWRLSPLNVDEADQVAQWYTRWTKREAAAGSAFSQTEGLLVSMMVELEFGQLRQFARRFRERLNSVDLDEALAMYLALNRLYLWPPLSWFEKDLTDKQLDAFDKLNKDDDFSLNRTGDSRDHIRLTHPHLSNAIYQTVRTDSKKRERSADLVRAFEMGLKEQPILASLLLQKIVDDYSLSDEEIVEAEINGISSVGRVKQQCHTPYLYQKLWELWLKTEYSRVSLSTQAWIWLNWTRWHYYVPEVKQMINHSGIEPINMAFDLLDNSLPKWGTIWLKLWEIKPNSSILINLATTWLAKFYSKNEIAWAFIWQTILKNHILPEKWTKKQLLTIGANWLPGREDRPDWAFVWRDLLAADVLPEGWNRERLLALGADWLAGREDRPEWSYVWQKLLVAIVLPKGWTKGQLLTLGTKWLEGRTSQADWSYVWQDLIAFDEEPPEWTKGRLLALGADWLAGREDRPEWNYVWQALLAADTLPKGWTKKKILSLGAEWLNGRESIRGWSYVWRAIFAATELPESWTKKKILNVGVDWLKRQERAPGWKYIWRDVVTADVLPDGWTREQLVALNTDGK